MALIGAGMLAGRLMSRKRGEATNPDQPLAPGPTNTATTGLPPPAPPILDPAAMNQQALGAATRQRKRTAAGSLLTNPTAPVSQVQRPVPRYATRSLLGS